ncbi:alpha/beta hydrolase [Nocardioides sp. cx-169]|uniref:alpha/beta fold hydrolase n=1 Tax=Nocardioides sp. cx-169 TaxID=2899080 RepID=UPI001E4670D0|nr:alpha/beta hydrolase [Nocardioides sp. cx-169]MCD4534872.1 alpha/beta hydrolase [Nocardioides sp. cx-169]
MALTAAPGATIPEVTHHLTDLNGTRLHHVSAGSSGSPILLVHGWPETWWAFHRLIPMLAHAHRVIAVDLRGFGDSGNADGSYEEAEFVEDLHQLVRHLGVGPVHLLVQDISGGVGFQLAARHPDDVSSLVAVETTLAGFGLESLADVNHGGSWHVGMLGAPGIAEMLLPGHEREVLDWAWSVMTVPGVVTEADAAEYLRTYTRPNAWRGTAGLYRSLFVDAGRTRALAEAAPLTVPVLAVDAVNGPFTEATFRQVRAAGLTSAHLQGVGHLVAQEAPQALAGALLDFTAQVDASGA